MKSRTKPALRAVPIARVRIAHHDCRSDCLIEADSQSCSSSWLSAANCRDTELLDSDSGSSGSGSLPKVPASCSKIYLSLAGESAVG